MIEHPIEGLMVTAMNSIEDMVDVNTIVGEPIETSNNTTIIPISKVCFGFAAGGSEFKGETIDEYSKKEEEENIQYRLPFGGGSGAGVSINPVAFLVVRGDGVKLLPINHSSAIDKLLDSVPDLFDKINETVAKVPIMKKNKKEEEKESKVNDVGAGFVRNTREKDPTPPLEEEILNTRRRQKRHMQKLEYNKKPETHIDEDIIEYIDDEEIDDQ